MIVKEVALSLVGAQLWPRHQINKRNQVKIGKSFVLPDGGKPDWVDESGKKHYSPHWDKSAVHPDNNTFMEALTATVSAVPVRSSSYLLVLSC
jgi:hypothetical protein